MTLLSTLAWAVSTLTHDFSTLLRILKPYFEYYEHSLTHLSLDKDAPEPRTIQPRELGAVVEIPELGGLHHRYEHRAA
jgi:putative transposase